ncbi:thrombospondin [Micromonospora sp. LOL_024]|uniref:thrombospondin n=1 Tax=Micromonospora sp. LOL_024 TaxID=3345412 RepID=UPI003A84864F
MKFPSLSRREQPESPADDTSVDRNGVVATAPRATGQPVEKRADGGANRRGTPSARPTTASPTTNTPTTNTPTASPTTTSSPTAARRAAERTGPADTTDRDTTNDRDTTTTGDTTAKRDTTSDTTPERDAATDAVPDAPPAPVGPRPRASLLATLGLIVGVAGVLFVLTGALAGYGIGLGTAGAVLAVVGLMATRRRHIAGKSDALLGIALGLGAVVIGVLAMTGQYDWPTTDGDMVVRFREWLDSQFVDRI